MYRPSPEDHAATTLVGYHVGARIAYGRSPGVAGEPCARCVDARFAAQGHRPERHPLSPAAALAGRIAQTLGEAAAPSGMLVEFAGTAIRTHLVLPVPGCPCGTDAPGTQYPVGAAISDLVGLVREIDFLAIPGLDPAVETIFASAIGCDVGAFGRPGGVGAGTGCGTAIQAERAAIGETLERYAAGIIPAGLVVATIGELDAPHLPADMHAFAHQPVGTQDALRWVRGHRLVDGTPCWVPAAMVYFPYVCGDTEPRRSTGSSQGLAAGPDLAQAAIHATCEVIERDTFMRAWRFDGARLRLRNPYPARPDLQFALVPNRFGLPVVTAFSEAAEVPYCIAGIAGRGSVADAVEAAAREVIGGRVFFGRRVDGGDRAIEARYRHATDPALGAARARWLARPFAEISTDRLSWDLFRTRVPDAVLVDITPSDVRLLGLVVVRVCVPGCHTFEPCADVPFLGGDRTPIPY